MLLMDRYTFQDTTYQCFSKNEGFPTRGSRAANDTITTSIFLMFFFIGEVTNLNLLLSSSCDVGDCPASFSLDVFLLSCCQKIEKTGKCLGMTNNTLW